MTAAYKFPHVQDRGRELTADTDISAAERQLVVAAITECIFASQPLSGNLVVHLVGLILYMSCSRLCEGFLEAG
jgi:hypothetical protein